MSTATEIAEHYFILSNNSDLNGIEKLLTDTTTYSSQNTGLFLGTEQIIEMQRTFHGSYESLNWDVKRIEEEKPGIVRFEFVFTGKKKSGENVTSGGIEYVIIHNQKIQHIEIRNI